MSNDTSRTKNRYKKHRASKIKRKIYRSNQKQHHTIEAWKKILN